MQSIRARTALDNRIRTISVKSIVASSTTKLVSASLAFQNVVAGTAGEGIITSTATKVGSNRQV